ncbi:WxL domain-containing protein [Lactiplantibacillus modestisalitolerans]|uniref:WxL domain-containing protein n=1 Tax=Lactiplantibacillus modestisalitolerans TaxID=1457219 RepID=A0ABV5WT39_9LACO|nr:WxL domain-containing protein [Lactiplantibacillus modestisalitolerans]
MKKTLLGLMLSVSLLAGAAINASAADDPQTSNGHVAFTGGDINIDNGNTAIESADLEFDSHQISKSDAGVYNNTNGKAKVAVQDLRGNPTGWSLSVAQGQQFHTGDGQELENAVITLQSDFLGDESSSIGDLAPTVTDELALTPGTKGSDGTVQNGPSQVLMSADNGKGNGTSTASIIGSRLNVPTKSARVATDYSTTLTWELAATPANE